MEMRQLFFLPKISIAHVLSSYLIKSIACWAPNGTVKYFFVAGFQCDWMNNFVIIQLTVKTAIDAIVDVVHHRFELLILA